MSSVAKSEVWTYSASASSEVLTSGSSSATPRAPESLVALLTASMSASTVVVAGHGRGPAERGATGVEAEVERDRGPERHE